MPLKGKHVVITGGNGGIGNALSNILREQGARVSIIDRIAGSNTRVTNLADADELDALCETLKTHRIDILINLAGLMYFGHFPEQNIAHLSTMLIVNLEVPMRLAQAVIPGMLQRGEGHIVNIGSVFGALPFPHFTTYSTTKAGLQGFSEALRREYAGKGISVTHVSPRAVNTPLNNEAVAELHQRTSVTNDTPEVVARIIAQAILRKRKRVTIGQPDRFFAWLNGLFPSLIDRALISKRNIADEVIDSYKL